MGVKEVKHLKTEHVDDTKWVFYALPLWGSCLGRDPNTVLPHYCFFFMLVLIIYSFYLIKKAFAASYILLEPSTRHHWLHTACYHCSDSEDQVWCHRAEPRLVLTSFHLQYAKLLCCEEPSLWNLHHPTQTSYSLGLGPGQLWADDTCQPFRQCSQLQLYYCPQAHLWSFQVERKKPKWQENCLPWKKKWNIKQSQTWNELCSHWLPVWLEQIQCSWN